jgi:ribonuclease-3
VLQDRLGHRFDDAGLLEQALTHRSARPGERGADYERLEYLGDALLGFLVAEWLWRNDPTASEGDLTRRKQEVVRSEALEACARRLQLGAALRLGKGEEGTGGREKGSLLADAFEAVLGAVYLDGGIRAARAFVHRHLRCVLEQAAAGATADSKTRLQEWTQARWHRTPEYRIVATDGPPHAPEFVAEVRLADRVMASGRGSTRKVAEQAAARLALSALETEDER